MTDNRHLKIFKQEVEAWYKWGTEHPVTGALGAPVADVWTIHVRSRRAGELARN